jgi:transcriptional regulator with XRE-family HTH domain
MLSLNIKGLQVQRDYLVEKIIMQKQHLGWTINQLSEVSGVSVRTINRILAKQDVRFSSIDALMQVLNLEISIDEKLSA